MPLAHRHGPCSLAISNEKPSLEAMLCRDQHHAAYIHAKVSGNGTKEALQQSAVTIPTSPCFSLGTAEYVVTVGVGTLAVSQVMSIDTGSDVSWVQCAPCRRNRARRSLVQRLLRGAVRLVKGTGRIGRL